MNIICVLSILFNIIIVNLNQRNHKIHGPLPKWIRRLVLGKLANLLRMKPPSNLSLTSNKIENVLVLIEKQSNLNEFDELKELIKEMKDLNLKLNEDLNLDSRFAANVINRFFLVVFSLITLISTIMIFTL